MAHDIESLLGNEADYLLSHRCTALHKDDLTLPGPDFVDRILSYTDRSVQVLKNFQVLLNNGRLAKSGYLSILPVDQGVEHSAGSAFGPNPLYFNPEKIVTLAIEGGCNAVASTLGVLGNVSRKYAHRIPFIVKLNHNELLSYPNTYDERMFASVL
jgi:class I fructose-bisphosphate aldolase